MSISHKNKIITNETKEKISLVNSGENNGMFGKTLSVEAKHKISEIHKKRKRRSISEKYNLRFNTIVGILRKKNN